MEKGVRLLAVSLIAGSAGTGFFRSLQDRLLSTLAVAKTEKLMRGLSGFEGELSKLKTTLPKLHGAANQAEGSHDLTAKLSELHGQVRAHLDVAS